MTDAIRTQVRARLASNLDPIITSADFIGDTPSVILELTRRAPNNQESTYQIYGEDSDRPWPAMNNGTRLKIGFISADWGVHPVSSLMRGVFSALNHDRFEVYCYSLQQVEVVESG